MHTKHLRRDTVHSNGMGCRYCRLARSIRHRLHVLLLRRCRSMNIEYSKLVLEGVTTMKNHTLALSVDSYGIVSRQQSVLSQLYNKTGGGVTDRNVGTQKVRRSFRLEVTFPNDCIALFLAFL